MEALKAQNIKDLETFKQGAKKSVEQLLAKHNEETEAFSAGEFREFADKTRAALNEEAKAAGKEGNSEEIDAKFKEAILQKEQEFDLRQLSELHALKLGLLEEVSLAFELLLSCLTFFWLAGVHTFFFFYFQEQKVHRGIQRKVRELQSQQQQKEHKQLQENLVALQSALEKHHDEQYELKKIEVLPATTAPSAGDKFQEAIEQMVVDREKDSVAEKEKARKEFDDNVRKIEEEAEKAATPTTPVQTEPEKDKKK